MKKLSLLSLSGLIVSALLLSACQSQSNTLTFTPPTPTTSVTMAQSAVVFVDVRDMRVQPEVASYVVDGKLVKLSALPTVTQLFQQVQQQDLISKGFRVGYQQDSDVTLTLDINRFYAKVEQGDLRYNIDSDIQVSVHVQGKKRKFSKTINSNRNYSGVFNAKNPEIQRVLGEAFHEIVMSIYKDHDISDAINNIAAN